MKVVIVTGSREWRSPPEIASALAGADALIVGDASGADALALALALERDLLCTVYAASPERAGEIAQRAHAARKTVRVRVVSDWRRDGPRAGHLRNKAIVDEAQHLRREGMDVRCHAFPLPSSRGTYDAIRQLRAAGFDVAVLGDAIRSSTLPPYVPFCDGPAKLDFVSFWREQHRRERGNENLPARRAVAQGALKQRCGRER